jgi:RNA polymerase-associated protein CTR9
MRILNGVVAREIDPMGTADFTAVYSLLANIQLVRARSAPKFALPAAREDVVLPTEKKKDDFYQEAAKHMNNMKVSNDEGSILPILTRGMDIGVHSLRLYADGWCTVAVYQLSTRALDDAMSSFQAVLKMQPTNVIALLGKVSHYTYHTYPGMNLG